MNVWGYILIFVVCAAAFILILAALSNLAVAWFAHRYADKTLKKHVDQVEKLLPGKNCGACGCETCAEYAAEVFYGRMDTDRCTQGDDGQPGRLDACIAKFQEILTQDEKKKEF